MQRVSPFLWFDHSNRGGGELLRLRLQQFKDRADGSLWRSGTRPGRQRDDGCLRARRPGIIALNGGPHFKFTEAISFVATYKTQNEVGEFWRKLSQGGEERQCGWLKDKYSLSWQIVPAILGELMSAADPEKGKRVMEAMLKMKKIDTDALKEAYAG